MQQLYPLIPYIGMIAVLYLIIFVPESRRKKKYNAMLNALSVNDEIITKGGIMGKIVNLQDDYVILQTGPDKARIQLSKVGILDRVVAEKTK